MSEQQLSQAAARDRFLDCLKGFAILTVVAGHTFQGATADFDGYWPFRVTYAFHMPMFMFVAGMTSAFFFRRQLFGQQSASSWDLPAFGRDLLRKAQRLLIPFLTWAVVGYALNPTGDFVSRMVKIIEFPDNGLWFLPVLFQCSVGLTAAALLVIAFRRYAPAGWAISWDDRKTQVFAFLIAAVLVNYAARALPNGLGLYLARLHFPYVAGGLLFQLALPGGMIRAVLRPIPYVIFVALVPFWYRTEISPIVAYVPFPGDPHAIDSIYHMVVAWAGTLAFVDLAGVIYRSMPVLAQKGLAFLGQRSLDVYAIHFYFLGKWPPVVAATLYSLGVSTLLRLTPWTALIFFGQRQSILGPVRDILPWRTGTDQRATPGATLPQTAVQPRAFSK